MAGNKYNININEMIINKNYFPVFGCKKKKLNKIII